jgi:hypothetical protein
MLNWRTLPFFSAVAAYALLLWWWSSSGYPTEAQICEPTDSTQNCSSHNILFALAWNVAKEFDHWSALITAIATVAIGYFTLTLKQSSDKMWRISERALTELEAPFVSIKINTPGLEIKGNSISFGLLKWCVVNYGRTPATILEVFQDTQAVKIGNGYPPVIEPQKIRGHLQPYGVIAPPNGQSQDFPFIPLHIKGDFRNVAPPPISEITPFFVGFVRYSDIFKNRFILGFCFVFDRDASQWLLAGGDEHNYCRKEGASLSHPL